MVVLAEAGAERLRWPLDFLEGVELAEAVEEWGGGRLRPRGFRAGSEPEWEAKEALLSG